MIYSSADRLEAKVGNKYALVIVAAKRARQLKEGAMPMAESISANPLSIALDEVAADKIVALQPPDASDRDPVLDLVAQDDTPAVLLSSLSAEDLDLEDGDAALLDDEEEEETPFILSTDDEEEEEETEDEAEAETDDDAETTEESEEE